ncbi:serine/threonine-protein kinase [Streptomyces sp. L2]|uniref:serine/threonine-protein kinase n=1 Tax=Streptomyces sp. L2 TaxID=2162665 RepID=UPI0010132AD3|nr:serine/threonine-protein kinase [Streptomyces sp. L2]
MGEVFAGRYELADPIGRGGVGAVWRAWDHRRRRYVAAKVLQQRDAHTLLRFVREQALRIDHPHVLAPASWAADDDQVLFTMDLVAGGCLVHLVGDYGPLPPAFVCTLLDQLLSGLAAVHAEGVVHRDIKPANLLLEATGTGRPRLRLSDFGIAMRLGEPRLTETNLVVGTPGYLAPEQLLGAEPDFPADLFAVGLVALYLLEGAKPDAKALVEYFVDNGTPGPPTGIPEPLWQVVATLLQPDPEARFRTATGARKALATARELLPEPGPDDELIEIFDQLGPLPPGFGPDGPLKAASGVAPELRRPNRAETTGSDGPEPTGSPGTGAAARNRATGTAATPHTDATPPTDPRLTTGHGTAPPLPAMSDTGSFPLPPPQPATPPEPYTPRPYTSQPYAPQPGQEGTGHPADAVAHPSPAVPPHERTDPAHRNPAGRPGALWSGASWPPHPPTPTPPPHPRPHADTSTASYTAHDPQNGSPAQRVAGADRPGTAEARRAPRTHRAHSRARARRTTGRRPGPPAKAAIPILLLALACYAVGFWALARG